MLRPLRVTVALAATTALLLAGCGEDPTVDVDPADEETTDATDEAEDPAEPDDGPDAAAEPEDGDDAGVDGTAADDGDEAAPTPPTPDASLVADPCADHEGRDDEGFIAVVSPVADQHVSGDAVELVGCSNVFEANVQWSLHGADGEELDAGFTTATCGSGCVGEFRDEVPLDVATNEASVVLHVYSEDAAGEQGRMFLNEIPLVLS